MNNSVSQPILFAFGLNHKTASVDIREKLYLHEDEIPLLLEKMRDTLAECLILSTCNRTEIYGVSNAAEMDWDFYQNLIIKFKKAEDFVRREHFFTAISGAACQQIFSVATSIDSQIIGDTQILKQLKKAYFTAQENNSIGKILHQLLQKAFKLGKKVHTETSIHKGAVSVSLAAVEQAFETFGSLKNRKVLIIGAGETANLTAECLLKRQVGQLFITNRTRENAEELLNSLRQNQSFAGEVIPLGDFKNYLHQIDLVISSTGSSKPILFKEDFSGQSSKILLLDLAMPRDIAVEVSENTSVILKNIDDLQDIIDDNFTRRTKDLPFIKQLIVDETNEFLIRYYSLSFLPDLRVKENEIDNSTIQEIRRVKEFLLKNLSEHHQFSRFNEERSSVDLQSHLQFIEKLKMMKNLVLDGFNA